MKINSPDTKISEKKTILVVDDTESIRLLIKSILEENYNIITMPDGHDALLYLSKSNIPDLILTDMEMPNMNGRIFVRRIRFGDIKHNKIPIIFITSVNSKIMIKSMMKLNVSGYIIKPFTPEDLTEKVYKILPP